MKDHEVALLVNGLREIAVEYGQTQQLRERIAAYVVPALYAALKAERARCAKVCDDIATRWRGANLHAIECRNTINALEDE